MKTYWILEPSPFKSPRSLNAVIYANVRSAQALVGRPLTRQEIAGLIKKMKDKGLLKSKQDNWGLYGTFMSHMKQNKIVVETKPTAA